MNDGRKFIITVKTWSSSQILRFLIIGTAVTVGLSQAQIVSGQQNSPSQLLNISTRLPVQGGDNVLIGGFIVTGSEPKQVIIRAIGPSLAQFFPTALADPTLEVYQGSTLLSSNDNWKTRPDGSSQQAEIEATGIAPKNELEAAVVITLPPGAYTAIVRGKDDSTGIAVVEAYDLNQAANSNLANISTRGFVQTADNVMIGGFIIGPSGGMSTTLAIRAIGPSLAGLGIAGALQDPNLAIYDANGFVSAADDNWRDSQAAEIERLSLQPSDPREAAVVLRLPPGNYTAIVRGNGDSVGVALVEVYNVASLPPLVIPDPIDVAPPPPDNSVPSFESTTSFLYKGKKPIQIGVTPGVIDPVKAAVVRGTVKTRDDQTLGGVHVAIHGKPEFGYTFTRADGQYDLALNGGQVENVDFEVDGYLPAQRQAQVTQQDFALTADVVMIPVDGIATTVSFGTNAPVQVANSSMKSDAAGSRSATLYFPAGTGAQLLYRTGATQSVDHLSVRATEYTVGPNGPAAMPATLPGSSAYTYCVALTADEAINAGAKSVIFSKNVPVYVDNYLGFPVGTLVPSGYFDRDKAAWIPADNGIVANVLSVTNGAADLDLDGTGTPASADTLANFGITVAEQQQIASNFAVGATFWRMPVGHFTDWDYNFPPTTDDEGAPPGNTPRPSPPNDKQPGYGELGLASQVFTEELPIAGAAMSLHYASDRVLGYKVNATLEIPLVGDTLPVKLTGTDVAVEIGGRTSKQSFPPQTNLVATFQWDGRDLYHTTAGSPPSDPVAGSATAHATLAYRYPERYAYGAARGRSNYVARDAVNPSATPTPSGIGTLVPLFGLAGTQPSAFVHTGIEDAILTRFDRTLTVPDQRKAGLDGWSLTPHHFYDPTANILYRGDGRQVKAEAKGRIVDFVYRPIAAFQFRTVAVRPNGDVYTSGDSYTNSNIYKITPSGQIFGVTAPTSTAGNAISANDPKLDGKLAADVFVEGGVEQLKTGPDGSLYVTYARTIWRLDQDDRFHLVLCGGASPSEYDVSSPDGTPANRAYRNDSLTSPGGAPNNIAIAKDGTVYFTDSAPNPNGDVNHHLETIRKIAPDGRLYTIAGLGGVPDFPDFQYAGNVDLGKPALTARLNTPTSMAVGPDDSLYYTSGRFGIVHIKKNGILELVLYGGLTSPAGLPDANQSDTDEGKLAITAGHPGAQAYSLNVTPDGVLHFRTIAAGVFVSNTIWSIAPDGILRREAGRYFAPALQTGDALLADIGQHLLDFNFGPDGKMYLVSNEQDAGLYSIRKISTSLPGFLASELTLASEDGQELYVFDQNGRHLRTIDPLLNVTLWTFSYDSNGFVTSLRDRDGLVTTIERDGAGHATTIVGPYGARTLLAVDSKGYLASVIAPDQTKTLITNSATGLLSSITGPRQDTYSFTYDDLGRLTHGIQPGGGFTTLARTGSDTDATVTATTAGGRIETRRLQRTLIGGTLTTLTISDEVPSTENYFPNGSRILSNLPSFQEEIDFASDPRPGAGGQGSYITLQRFTTPSGTKTDGAVIQEATLASAGDLLSVSTFIAKTSIDGFVWTNSYTADTRKFTLRSPEARELVSEVNTAGRPLSTKQGNLALETFTYDNFGRLTSTSAGGSATARTLMFGYDANGFQNVIHTADGRETHIINDVFGSALTVELPGNRAVALTYGPDGGLESVTPPGRPKHTFDFDPVTGRTTYTAPPLNGVDNTTIYEPNIDRQLSRITSPGGRRIDVQRAKSGKISGVTDTFGDSFSYDYDTVGRLNKLSRGQSNVLSLSYDGPAVSGLTWSGLTTGSLARQLDSEFRVSSEAINNELPIAFAYTPDGLMKTAGALTITWRADANLPVSVNLGGMAASYEYDEFGDIIRATSSVKNAPVLELQATRDLGGRITTETSAIAGGTPVTTEYSYDAAGFLASVKKNGLLASTYLYDSNGNLTTENKAEGSVNYTYDAQDRLLAAGATTFTYTDAGELKTRVSASGSTSYSYDEFGQLRRVVMPDGRLIEYALGTPRMRVAKSVNGTRVQGFLRDDGGTVLAVLGPDNGVVSRFVYSALADAPAYMVRGGITFSILTDTLGSVRLVVDVQSGAIAQLLDYDEWGRVTLDTNPGFQPFGFAGGIYDTDTGLVRLGERDYDPSIRRWTASDPIKFRGGTTNLYAYIANDPVNLTDADGLGPNQVGRLYEVKGDDLKITRAGRTILEGRPRKDFPLFVGDEITTGRDTVAAFEFLIGGRTGVKKNTTVKILNEGEAAQLEGEELKPILLRSGGVWEKFTRAPRPLTIQTRGGVIGIRE